MILPILQQQGVPTRVSDRIETMNIVERIKKLNLPVGHYVVVGSGVMDALGMRPAHDIDIAVTPELFKTLRTSGVWEEELYCLTVLVIAARCASR